MAIYSHSKLGTFEQCPLKFKLRYLDKIKPIIEKTIEAHLGSAVHNTLEWLYKLVLKGKTPSLDETIMHYGEEWEKNYSENIIIQNGLTDKEYFNRGVQFILDYYLKHQPFKDGTLELEKKIIIKLDENLHIQGFIDRLVKNIQTGQFEIHDYKTAGNLPSQEKIDSDRQLALYSIAIIEEHKAEEVKLIWHYLNFNKKIESKRTPKQIEELKEQIKNLVKEIESTKKFPPQKSVLCNWCEYKEICPAWKEYNEKEVEDITKLKSVTPEIIKKIKSELETEKEKTAKNEFSKYPTLSKYLK